jgi:hypothetical protein
MDDGSPLGTYNQPLGAYEMRHVKPWMVMLFWTQWFYLSCAVYNDSCPITTPRMLGSINVDLDIRKDYVRQCEAPIGNFFADALLNYRYGVIDNGVEVPVQLALFNAGGIRAEVKCGELGDTRETIHKGPITDQDLFQVMPFLTNTVVIVKLRGEQLIEVLERSVSAHCKAENPDCNSPKGYFLQISGNFDNTGKAQIKVTVDCSKDPQTLNPIETRILNPGERIMPSGICIGPAGPNCFNPQGIYYLATVSFMTEESDGVPNDGFVTFQESDVKVFNTNLPVIDVIRDWIEKYDNVQVLEGRADYPSVDPDPAGRRWVFQNCSNTEICGGG